MSLVTTQSWTGLAGMKELEQNGGRVCSNVCFAGCVSAHSETTCLMNRGSLWKPLSAVCRTISGQEASDN